MLQYFYLASQADELEHKKVRENAHCEASTNLFLGVIFRSYELLVVRGLEGTEMGLDYSLL